MARRPSMQFYTADFLTGTQFMTRAAVGAYISMLCHSWETGPIPDSRTGLFKSMGLGPDDDLDRLWAELQPKWALGPNGWTNAKLEKVRAERDRYVEVARANGEKGGRPRKTQTKSETETEIETQTKPTDFGNTNRNINPAESSPTPSPSPSSSPQKEQKSAATADADATPSVLLTYPTVGKPNEWHLTERHLRELQDLYPALDVMGQCRRALAWCTANSPKRKTAKGMPAFLVKWMNREKPLPLPINGRGTSGALRHHWRDECAEVHGGRCENATFHAAEVAEDASLRRAESA